MVQEGVAAAVLFVVPVADRAPEFALPAGIEDTTQLMVCRIDASVETVVGDRAVRQTGYVKTELARLLTPRGVSTQILRRTAASP